MIYNYFVPQLGYLKFDDDNMTIQLDQCFEVEMKINLFDRIKYFFGSR
jgi:hypothetical protein